VPARGLAYTLSGVAGRLSWKTKLLYGCGDTGFSLTSTLIGAYLAIFLTDVAGLAPGLAAAALFIGRTWDYLNDPMVGYLSDRTRTRWGRRRPYLLFGALPFGLAFVLLWWRPPLHTALALTIYYALAYLVYDAASTFVGMPYLALTPELSADYDERTSLTSYRMFFSIFASLLSFTVPLLLIGAFRPENSRRVLLTGLLFGLASAVPLFLVFAGTRERREFSEARPPRLRESLKSVVSNRPFRLGMGIYVFTWIAVDLVQAIILYFLKYCVRRESQGDLILGAIFVAALPSLPLWNWLSRKWDKRVAFIVGVSFWTAVQLVIVSLGPSTPLAVLLGLCVLAGFGVGAAHVLPWSILPDAIEYNELKTGVRQEGTFYSVVTLAQKVASSISVPLCLLLLQLSGYRANQPEQSLATTRAIRLLMGVLPGVLLGLGTFCAARYPLGRADFARIAEEVERRRLAPREPTA
jgi:GPH family glycoside/pentoside/hexuronide:cation symporter